MSPKEAGDVRAEGHDAQMMGASKIQRGARKLCGQPFTFEWRWNFRVLEDHAIRKSAISDEGAKAIHGGFEAMSLFIVGDTYIVQL